MKSLDLHGFTTDEALDAIDQFLHSFSQSGAKRAKIITGKGSGKIQKLTKDYLKKSGYQFAYETMGNGKENTGVLIIFGD